MVSESSSALAWQPGGQAAPWVMFQGRGGSGRGLGLCPPAWLPGDRLLLGEGTTRPHERPCSSRCDLERRGRLPPSPWPECTPSQCTQGRLCTCDVAKETVQDLCEERGNSQKALSTGEADSLWFCYKVAFNLMIAKCKKFFQKKKKMYGNFEALLFQTLAVLELRGSISQTSGP